MARSPDLPADIVARRQMLKALWLWAKDAQGNFTPDSYGSSPYLAYDLDPTAMTGLASGSLVWGPGGLYIANASGVPELAPTLSSTPDFSTTGIKADAIAESTSGAGVSVQGLRTTSTTPSSITGAVTLSAADSGGKFLLAKDAAYAVGLPTPAQGLDFVFVVRDTGANAVTFSDGSAHFSGQIQEAGTTPIAMTGTTITAAASQAAGDWIRFEGIDASNYLVTGSSISASKWTIA